MSTPILIDPEAFAAEAQTLQGQFVLADFDERVWAHEFFAGLQDTVSFRLTGTRDRLKRLCLDLSVAGDLSLICQRCVAPVPFRLDETCRIVLFADEQSLDEAMLADEELEGMVIRQETDIRELVEDQILMSLPFSPRHDDCTNAALETVNHNNPNPFAALAGLKSRRPG